MSEETKNPTVETPETAEAEVRAEQIPQEEGKEKKKLSERKLRSELDKAEKRAREAENKLKNKQQELDDTVRLLQRNQADFENFRRRNNNAKAESYDNGRRDAIAELLPTLDDFERIMASATEPDEAYMEGMNLVYKKFSAALSKLGLTPLEEEGKFDPNLHNAVMSEAVEGVESGTIIAVFQKGYKLGDRILRHSMVKVSE